MDVLVCAEPRELKLEQWPKSARSEGKVLVRLRRIGVCSTDLHLPEPFPGWLDPSASVIKAIVAA